MAVFPAPFPDNVYSLRVYQTGALTANFVDTTIPFPHPVDIENLMTVANARQAWSYGIKVKVSAVGGDYVEYSFDGTNVHGKILAGEAVEPFFARHEGGISLRGVGTYWLEAW
jgi:hypothetical protein